MVGLRDKPCRRKLFQPKEENGVISIELCPEQALRLESVDHHFTVRRVLSFILIYISPSFRPLFPPLYIPVCT